MPKTNDEIIKEFFEKGISPTLDANDWKEQPLELLELVLNAKAYKVHLIIENSVVLGNAHCEEFKRIGKEWVILK